MLLFIVVPIVCVGFCGLRLFCCALLGVLSTFTIILPRKSELVSLLVFPTYCIVTVSVLRLLPHGFVS